MPALQKEVSNVSSFDVASPPMQLHTFHDSCHWRPTAGTCTKRLRGRKRILYCWTFAARSRMPLDMFQAR